MSNHTCGLNKKLATSDFAHLHHITMRKEHFRISKGKWLTLCPIKQDTVSDSVYQKMRNPTLEQRIKIVS